MLEFEAKVGI